MKQQKQRKPNAQTTIAEPANFLHANLSSNKKYAGVMVPLFSLRGEQGCGCGEFADLFQLLQWCHQTGLQIVQLLPLNDTGGESSPYSAIHSLALNPLYCAITMVQGFEKVKKRYDTLAQKLNHHERVDYSAVRRAKLACLRLIFDARAASLQGNERFQHFLRAHDWLKLYAAFCVLKDTFNGAWWRKWPQQFRKYEPTVCDRVWRENREKCLFYCFVQWTLDEQLRAVRHKADELGIAIKGDIPILMSDDSADGWAHQNIFDASLHAGAPPDMFSDKGQNWGFPIYRWDELARHDYGWWRRRLAWAERYYHAIRIDHVLGFFRIWAVPHTELTARLGFFVPSVPITIGSLRNLGLTKDDIDKLSKPLFSLKQLLSPYPATYRKQLLPLLQHPPGTRKGWYSFAANIKGEKDLIHIKDIDEALWDDLLIKWAQRVLIRVPGSTPETFAFRWDYLTMPQFASLSKKKKRAITTFLSRYEKRQYRLWRVQGDRLLDMLSQSSSMLVCAEDLGYVPPIVRPMLAKKGILALKVLRWERDYSTYPAPFIVPRTYPRLSVCTSSVHDSTTLRGWYEENWDETTLFCKTLGIGEPPPYLTEEVAQRALEYLLTAPSYVAIIPLQDWLSLTYDFRTYHPESERINVPGTISSGNWSYRMSNNVQDLSTAHELNNRIRTLLKTTNRL